MKIKAYIGGRSEAFKAYDPSMMVLLGFLLLFSADVVQAQFLYTTNAGGTSITITEYSGPGEAVSIPSSINGLTVTSIGAGAFVGPFFTPDVSLTSITIPASVTNIGDYAFYNCSDLMEVTISNGLIGIGEGAFGNCAVLVSLSIPASVHTIGDGAFENCTMLTNVVMSDGLASIGNDAFSGCTNLANAAIPGALTTIGSDAFEACIKLTTVIIPGTVTTIGSNAFEYCTGLTNASIRYGVTNIEAYAFYECGGLATLVIPGSVNAIGTGAFANTSLTNLTISNGVSVIGEVAFSGCTLLTSVNFPASVTSIGLQAFTYCSSLTNVTFSNGLTSIGLSAFYGDPISTLTLPASVVSAGYMSFCGCNLSSLTINGGLTGDYAFFGCGSLTNVTIGAGVTNLAYGMFDYCNNLSNVFFQGNSPLASGDPEDGTNVFYSPATCYYLPGTTGWSNTYQEVPAVLWNPLIQTTNGNFGVQNNQFGFDITGTTNIPIVVQASTNPANPVWTSLTNVTLTNGLFHFTDPVQPNTPNRFYRIASP